MLRMRRSSLSANGLRQCASYETPDTLSLVRQHEDPGSIPFSSPNPNQHQAANARITQTLLGEGDGNAR
jgi:hypothetical protein